jgi:hypothetical protein
MSTNEIRRQAFFHLRSLGYSPIPMRRGAVRKPCIKSWSAYAKRQATDLEINQWIKLFPDCNVAVCCGYNGLCAVDIDDAGMIPSIAEILPNDTTGKRGSKGVTVFYRSVIKTQIISVDKKAAVEFLSAGRLTTVPPSVHDGVGKLYSWVSPLRAVTELPVLTQEMADACFFAAQKRYGAQSCKTTAAPDRQTPDRQTPDRQTPDRQTPDPALRAYAQKTLENKWSDVSAAPVGGRSMALFGAACALGRYVHHGVLAEDAVSIALMDACHKNGLLAEDGPDSISAQIDSGLKKAAGDGLPNLSPAPEEIFGSAPPPVPPGGSLTPTAPMPAPSAPSPWPTAPMPAPSAPSPWPTAPAPAPEMEFLWAHDGTLPEEESELIENLLPETPGRIAAIVGASGAGKSFYAVLQGACLAAGKPFLGQSVKYPSGVPVIYAAAEGEGTILPRLYAARREIGLTTEKIPFGLLTKFGNLLDPTQRAAFINRVNAVSDESERYGYGRVRVLYIDTISAAMAIDDENNNSQVAGVCKILKDIGKQTGTLVVIVHHMGKDKEKGMRGASAWRDNIDFGVSISKGSIGILKNRNGSEGLFCHFSVENIIISGEMSQWGKPRTSGFIRRIDAPPAEGEGVSLDDCFEEAAGPEGNSARLSHIEELYKRKCNGSYGSTRRGELKRWRDAIKYKKNKRYFTVGSDLIVRASHE